MRFDLDGGVTVNGVADTALSGAGTTQLFHGGRLVELSPNTYQIEWTSGEALTVANAGIYFNLNMTLELPPGPGLVQGLLGSDSGQANDFQLPDGTVLRPPPVSDSQFPSGNSPTRGASPRTSVDADRNRRGAIEHGQPRARPVDDLPHGGQARRRS